MTGEFVIYRDSNSWLQGPLKPRGPFYTIEADSIEGAEEIFRSFYRKSFIKRLFHLTESWRVDRLVRL